MKLHTRHQLIAAIQDGFQPKYLCFWGHTPGRSEVGPWVFSQWYEGAPFFVDGDRFLTAEHYMMAGKATLMGDRYTRQRILDAKHPAEAKKLGRVVSPWDDDAWYAERFDIVVAGNVAKFGKNPTLRAYLLGTGDRVLVEAAPRDRIWGIGLGAKNPKAVQPENWRGQNLLGFALMEARRQLRLGAAITNSSTPLPVDIPLSVPDDGSSLIQRDS